MQMSLTVASSAIFKSATDSLTFSENAMAIGRRFILSWLASLVQWCVGRGGGVEGSTWATFRGAVPVSCLAEDTGIDVEHLGEDVGCQQDAAHVQQELQKQRRSALPMWAVKLLPPYAPCAGHQG